MYASGAITVIIFVLLVRKAIKADDKVSDMREEGNPEWEIVNANYERKFAVRYLLPLIVFFLITYFLHWFIGALTKYKILST